MRQWLLMYLSWTIEAGDWQCNRSGLTLLLERKTPPAGPGWRKSRLGWLFPGRCDLVRRSDDLVMAAAALATERIRLGTMVIPVPLRKPWKIASEVLPWIASAAGD